MALAYPEGVVYFRRDALVHGPANWFFDPRNENVFYEHGFIEFAWNTYFAGGSNPQTFSHPRSTYENRRAQGGYRTYFCWWSSMAVQYGPNWQRPTRHQRIALNMNPNDIRDYDMGGPAKVVLHHFQLPNKNEKFMYLDLAAPIRAIYFPLAWKADEDFPGLSAYLMINFQHRERIRIWQTNIGSFVDHTCDRTLGLRTTSVNLTLTVDVEEAYALLVLPKELRNTNVYTARIVQINPSTAVSTSSISMYRPTPQNIHFLSVNLDFVQVINASFGVDLQWRPYQWSSTVLALIQWVVEKGLSIVPGVGPLLSVSFSLGIKAISDPAGFREDFRGQMAEALIDVILEDAMKSRKNLPAGWAKPIPRGTAIEGASPKLGLQLSEELVIVTDERPGEPEDENKVPDPETYTTNAWREMCLDVGTGVPRHAEGEAWVDESDPGEAELGEEDQSRDLAKLSVDDAKSSGEK